MFSHRPARRRVPRSANLQPWEWLGQSRRDCDSHRGEFLCALATISLVVGGLSILSFFPAILGLPLALLTRRLARRDLDRIFAGDVDHNGYELTERARSKAHEAVVLNLLGSLCWLGLAAGLYLLIRWPY